MLVAEALMVETLATEASGTASTDRHDKAPVAWFQWHGMAPMSGMASNTDDSDGINLEDLDDEIGTGMTGEVQVNKVTGEVQRAMVHIPARSMAARQGMK